MGTTQDAIRAGNCTLAYCLVIEGYPYIITDGDPAAAVTAWAATSWTQALPGLKVAGSFKQSLSPWGNELHVPRFRFSVQPDENDTFGIDMFKAKPSVRSELTVGFSSGDSGGGGFNINVKDADLFSTGQVYIGNEAFNVTSAPSGTTIPVATNGSGYLAPFGTSAGSANTFPGPHSLPAGSVVGAYEAVAPVYVTDSPPRWTGKKVGLWVHRVVDGVLDTKAQAELWFAGTITKVSEDGMDTVIDCEGIQQSIVDSVLMQDQWTGKVREGYYFTAGSYFWVHVDDGATTLDSSAKLTAVASSPGANEFLAGRYTAEEFASILAEHLDNDGAIGVSGTNRTLRWSCHVFSADRSAKFVLKCQESASFNASIGLLTNDSSALEFLGFTNFFGTEYDAVWSDTQTGTEIELAAQTAPYLIPPPSLANGLMTLQIEDTDGTFVDHTSALPPDARAHATGAEVWSYYSIDDKFLFLGRRDSDTQISGITVSTAISNATNADLRSALRKSASETNGVVKQLFFISGSFQEIVTQLFASIDGNGENESTYDVWPFGAGIPWDLLGTSFTNSLKALEESGVENSISLLIERPTRLWDAIRSDFALRMAAPIWKDGGLQIAQLTVPNASASDFTLDETNKADKNRTTTEHTSEFLVHTIKVNTDRNPFTQKYQDHFIARDVTAYESAGGSGATKTINARNTYSAHATTGASAEALADLITARFLPVFSKELRKWRRSIPHTLFHMAPGDTVTFSDDFVRDPATGQRGVSSRPAVVLGVEHSLGFSSGGQTYFGTVDLLYSDEDRLFPICPSAEHVTVTTTGTGRSWTDGYDDEVGTGGVFSILVYQNSFSASSSKDSDSFTVGDAIRITEVDPANPASADSFTDTIAAINTGVAVAGSLDEIVLTTGFGNAGNPAFSGSKNYVIEFDSYSNCGSAQRLFAFQADDADGQVEDLAEPNLVADTNKIGTFTTTITELPSRYAAQQYGDGVPVSAALMREGVRMANNLTNYKTAPHSPMMADTAVICSTSGSSEYVVIWTIPYFIGNENWPGTMKRTLNIAPLITAGGGTVTCRVTSSANAPKSDSWTDATWQGPKKQISFSTASASYGVATSQELEIVRADGMPEFTWITVEGNDLLGFRGLSEFWLGPLK